ERINTALIERILEREKTTPSVHKSNWGGWQSPDDFDKWCGPEGEAVLGMARTIAGQMTADRAGTRMNLDWMMNAWANVNRAGQGNEFHTHPGAYWSATYYVQDGGIPANPGLGGEFEMADPRGVAPAMLAPHFAFATPGGQAVGASELIQPRAGMLVMFPSWLSHGVRPYEGDKVRISIALNLTPA
ncbi:MAG: TIGR02466 family protein, partial [Pseudomonadota bacterium]